MLKLMMNPFITRCQLFLWHQITSISIDEPFNLTFMYCTLNFQFKDYSTQKTLINFLNDIPLCNLIDIACLIVERLPCLQIVSDVLLEQKFIA